MNCDELREVAPELAAGTLSGELRAEALAHLEHCAECRTEVDEHAAVVEELLSLVPYVEPPAGFGDRVLASLPGLSPPRAGRDTASRPRSGGHRLVLAAAAVVVLLAGAAGGWAMATATGARSGGADVSHQASGPLEEATFFSAGRPVGQMYAYWGSSSWVYMSVQQPAWSGRYSCELVESDGTVVTLGSFEVHDGAGWWAVPVHLQRASIRDAHLLDASGHVVATAAL